MRRGARERVALPVHRGPERGRGVRARVPRLPRIARVPAPRGGARRGARGAEGHFGRIARARAGTDAEVLVRGRLRRVRRQRAPDGVLHVRGRLAPALHGGLRGAGRVVHGRGRAGGVRRAARGPDRLHARHARRGGGGRVRVPCGRAARRRARHEVDDALAPRAAGCARGEGAVAAGGVEGRGVLPQAGLDAVSRTSLPHLLRRDGPGVLHALGGRGMHDDLA